MVLCTIVFCSVSEWFYPSRYPFDFNNKSMALKEYGAT